MSSHLAIVDVLTRSAAAGESVVLATVVRVIGSSYGGVGTRMVVRVDGSTVGLVSGGCLESDLAEHARRVHARGRAEVVSYDTRADDDAVWGLGLGCNGLIDVMLEPLAPAAAQTIATLLDRALASDTPAVLATVVQASGAPRPEGDGALPSVGAHALFTPATIERAGDWGDGTALAAASTDVAEALVAGRRGLVRDYGDVQLAFEVVAPAVRLVIGGCGPDVAPVVRLASTLGWNVTVVDHRAVTVERAARFRGARVVDCEDASRLADVVALTSSTAAVVMSHNFARDVDYVQALMGAGVGYVGLLGPRARTERLLAELAARGHAPADANRTLFAPVGLDVGGDGPDAVALAIVGEVSAAVHGRPGGHLRDRKAGLHDGASPVEMKERV